MYAPDLRSTLNTIIMNGVNKSIIVICFLQLFAIRAFAQEDFLAGIVSTDQVDFNACYSADGKSFYFSRSINGRSAIYVTHRDHDGWSTAQRLPFCDDAFSYADPAFSPSGEFYFISNRPQYKGDTLLDYDIWKSFRVNEQWTSLVNVSTLNSAKDEYYISFDERGDAYFSSSRDGGYGAEDLYVANFDDDKFGKPINLGPDVNSMHSEYDPFVNHDGTTILFASSGRKDALGKSDLYWAEKDGVWRSAIHLDEPSVGFIRSGHNLNTVTRDYCPYISRDGYFFFSSDGQVKRIPLDGMSARFAEAFKSK